MHDQAQVLRNLVRAGEGRERPTRILTVASGKGGVGKSNFTLNFAITLQKKGFKVLIFDADIGFANIDVLMGIAPKYHLHHLLRKERSLEEVVHQGPEGLKLIAGGSGFHDLSELTEQELDDFNREVNRLNGSVDIILFDTGAGLSRETLRLIQAAQETMIVTTPEPTSITDAYAVIKMVCQLERQVRFRLVINRCTNDLEGEQTAHKIVQAARKFLQIEIDTLGFVSDDACVSRSVKQQVPFSIAFPNSAAARSLSKVTNRYVESVYGNGDRVLLTTDSKHQGMKGFMNQMIRLLKW